MQCASVSLFSILLAVISHFIYILLLFQSHEDSDGGCSSEEVVLSNATLCENPEPLETPGNFEAKFSVKFSDATYNGIEAITQLTRSLLSFSRERGRSFTQNIKAYLRILKVVVGWWVSMTST